MAYQNPFIPTSGGLNLNTGGTTTQATAPTSTLSSSATPTTPYTTQVKQPAPIAPTNTIPSNQTTTGTNTYGLNKTSSNWYQLQPGETTANYYHRTQGQTQAQALAQTQPTGQSAPPPPSTPPTNTNSYTATAPTYGGLIGSLAGTAAAPTTGFTTAQNTAQTAATNLLSSAPQQNAAVLAEQQRIQALQNEAANAFAGNASNPIPLEFQQGRGQVLQNLYANRLAAEQTALQNILQGNAQQQAAFTGAGNVANTLQGAATSQQGTQQQGLGAAAALTAPQAYGITNVPFNPVTGQFGGIAGVQGQGGVSGIGALNTQISQGGAIQQMTGQQAQAQALANNLTNLLNSSGINMTAGAGALNTFYNGVQQWIDKNTGDPQYQNFANLINEISARYASILNQSGGTPTDQSTLSHQIINSLASGQDIKTVIGMLDKNATDSISALKGAAGSNAITSSGSTGGTTSVGGYNFVQQPDGTWKAQ